MLSNCILPIRKKNSNLRFVHESTLELVHEQEADSYIFFIIYEIQILKEDFTRAWALEEAFQ